MKLKMAADGVIKIPMEVIQTWVEINYAMQIVIEHNKSLGARNE